MYYLKNIFFMSKTNFKNLNMKLKTGYKFGYGYIWFCENKTIYNGLV